MREIVIERASERDSEGQRKMERETLTPSGNFHTLEFCNIQYFKQFKRKLSSNTELFIHNIILKFIVPGKTNIWTVKFCTNSYFYKCH